MMPLKYFVWPIAPPQRVRRLRSKLPNGARLTLSPTIQPTTKKEKIPMKRLTASFLLLVLVEIIPLPSFAAIAQSSPATEEGGTGSTGVPASQLIANGEVIYIGWTKAQVRKQNGEPSNKSQDGNTWWYGAMKVVFVNGKVVSTNGQG
jgi:hypothetical protein